MPTAVEFGSHESEGVEVAVSVDMAEVLIEPDPIEVAESVELAEPEIERLVVLLFEWEAL